MWRKIAGPRVGLVAADALEDARAVVQAVREHVDLGVLPGDELAVVPDQLRFDHCRPLPFAIGARARPPSPARCSPLRRDRASADRLRARGRRRILPRPPRASKRRPWRSSSATERNIASGLAMPLPAMSGAEPCTGSNRPGPSPPSDALGSIPIEPVIIAASSLRMSPNMFSVTITSKRRRRADERHRGVVDEQVLERDVRELLGVRRAATTSRHSREVSSTLALSTLVTRRRAAPKATRAIRSISSTV